MSKWVPYKPWKIESYLSPELRQKLREKLVFVVASGTQQAYQSPTTEQNFRYPAPTSHKEEAHVPSTGSKKNVYSTQYYTRDVRRFKKWNKAEVGIHPSLAIAPPAELPADTFLGSPGNKNPAVLAYDPTGTRSAMSTTFAARDSLIEALGEDTHLVRMEWEPFQAEIVAEYEANGTPPVPGRPFPWDMPNRSRIARW
ncbi:hypothetical protein SDRG_08262 [Saprolegnia diclina VS20]|uniref:Uncharacterized protein n=1 Tax=Saprolegnia diclina (strain VS20) TaxID=1156394 RepID=T0RNU5_SAPDV|nr:hypothetical protein SDRG_08262 [Saprolegnia diclina VS20]EQC34048.1 hypothetical protein SDRG_08262 [Saprolegnia diclina VS20]|eukprot:XP_008612360.1 hypothetical protein SDRG_08262 [Saprolegnia diclina VS20]